MMLLLLLTYQIFYITELVIAGNHQKVRLTEVPTLTLYQNQDTTGRRSSPVPQLRCTGGTAGCDAVSPSVVQCYNRGTDGFDVQWECKTDMDNAYKFGRIQVTCEGFDYPDDPYILKGSCGLEYTIDYDPTSQGKTSDSTYHVKSPKNRSSWLADIVFWTIMGLFLLVLYRIFIASPGPTGPARAPGGSSGGGGPWGGGGPGGAPPPGPGFRPDYYPADDSCSGSSYPGHSSSSRNYGGQGPGFWTGLGAGGLLGYLMGNRGNTNYGHRGSSYWDNTGRPGPSGSSWGSPSAGSFGGMAGTSRTASGFGGTRRR